MTTRLNEDTITCYDKNGAKNVIDSIGSQHIKDWEFLDNGKVKIFLNCRVKDIAVADFVAN